MARLAVLHVRVDTLGSHRGRGDLDARLPHPQLLAERHREAIYDTVLDLKAGGKHGNVIPAKDF